MPLKILLADDSMTAQRMGVKILSEAGHEVLAVSNGAAASRKLPEFKPDLVILDVYMPGYSGLEVCEQIKKARETVSLPVLLTVGKLEPFRPEDGKRVRADGVIIKPFEASELLRAVARLMGDPTSPALPAATKAPAQPARAPSSVSAGADFGRSARKPTPPATVETTPAAKPILEHFEVSAPDPGQIAEDVTSVPEQRASSPLLDSVIGPVEPKELAGSDNSVLEHLTPASTPAFVFEPIESERAAISESQGSEDPAAFTGAVPEHASPVPVAVFVIEPMETDAADEQPIEADATLADLARELNAEDAAPFTTTFAMAADTVAAEPSGGSAEVGNFTANPSASFQVAKFTFEENAAEVNAASLADQEEPKSAVEIAGSEAQAEAPETAEGWNVLGIVEIAANPSANHLSETAETAIGILVEPPVHVATALEERLLEETSEETLLPEPEPSGARLPDEPPILGIEETPLSPAFRIGEDRIEEDPTPPELRIEESPMTCDGPPVSESSEEFDESGLNLPEACPSAADFIGFGSFALEDPVTPADGEQRSIPRITEVPLSGEPFDLLDLPNGDVADMAAVAGDPNWQTADLRGPAFQSANFQATELQLPDLRTDDLRIPNLQTEQRIEDSPIFQSEASRNEDLVPTIASEPPQATTASTEHPVETSASQSPVVSGTEADLERLVATIVETVLDRLRPQLVSEIVRELHGELK